ncbi:MAG: hypothetical protein R8G66_08835 [Cytophagales bacterium]|nr:hypothetical protein [Cytophagales bacterium]
MQYITIESPAKKTVVWSRGVRLFLGLFLVIYGFTYFTRGEDPASLLYYSLGVMALVGGTLTLFYYVKGPYLRVNSNELKFKLSLRDSEHTISWLSLQSIRFEKRNVYFEVIDKGEWPVHFNCSKDNFDAIKRALRHQANEYRIEVKEQEYINASS